ncbi:MAG: ABC transporter permease [Armatimonadetes bacterium CG2_30_59_28]|nr:MAG: ABC transporter permease [Armatimonadetes bacterium CG2_30_59_28]
MCAVFFGLFLYYPLLRVLKGSVYFGGRTSFELFPLLFTDATLRECLLNSLKISVVVLGLSTVVSFPLAAVMVKLRFPGKALLSGLLLVPIIMPPFVGAIGMRQVLSQSGPVNILLKSLHLPAVDWLTSGFGCVVVLEALHLYPIMYLNIAAAWANVDPGLEEAAQNLGGWPGHIFRTVTLPLLLPGYFAGSIIVFIWALTDLGTPLMFGYRKVIPVKIFDSIKDINENPMGYVLVVLVVVITVAFFYASRRILEGRQYAMMTRGHVTERERPACGVDYVWCYVIPLTIVLIALIPHASVLLTSISKGWSMTVLPEHYTGEHYGKVFSHDLTLTAIRNSLFYSTVSTLADIVLGFLIAYLLVRKSIPGKAVLDATAMLPLALPGIVLAFGYVVCYSGTLLDPRQNPVPLLILSYAVRRLPYSVRAAYAGFQQTSVTLEEAAQNLGASPFRSLMTITLPLISANLIAGAILSFSFAMLEVSDSLILAMTEKYYPVTKAIYVLVQRLGDGAYIASALGILGMLLLTVSLLLAGKLMGKKMGEMFRV